MNRFSVFSFFAPFLFFVGLCGDFGGGEEGMAESVFVSMHYLPYFAPLPFVWTYSRLILLRLPHIYLYTLARRLFMRRKFLIPVTITTPLCFFESLRIFLKIGSTRANVVGGDGQ